MATSPFFMPTYQNSIENPNESLRNTYLVNGSGEIQTEPPQESRGREPGSKPCKEKPKKPSRRGMGVARLERLRMEEENKNMFLAHGGGYTSSANPNPTLSHNPGVVLQGFPRYGTGGPNMSVGNRFLCGGVGSGQIPVYSPPWGFVETSTHVPSSIPNPQVYIPSNNHCDIYFKKQRIDGDQNVVRSNGGGVLYDPRGQGFLYDHRIARCSAPPSASTNQFFNEATNHTGSKEELGSGSPRNGTRDVKEYEFFPVNDGNKSVSSVGDCSPNTSTIDLSLKL